MTINHKYAHCFNFFIVSAVFLENLPQWIGLHDPTRFRLTFFVSTCLGKLPCFGWKVLSEILYPQKSHQVLSGFLSTLQKAEKS